MMPRVTHVYRKDYGASIVVIECGTERIHLSVQNIDRDNPAMIHRISDKSANILIKKHGLDVDLKLFEVEDAKE